MPNPGTDIQLYLTHPSPQSPPFITTYFNRQFFDTLHGLSYRGQSHRQVGVPAICVAGVGERLPRMDTRVYTLPTFQGNVAFKGPSWELQPPAARFSHVHIDLVGPLPVSSGLRYCLTSPFGLRHSLPLRSPPKQCLRPSSPSGFLVSAVPIKSQPTRTGNLSPVLSRLCPSSPDPLYPGLLRGIPPQMT